MSFANVLLPVGLHAKEIATSGSSFWHGGKVAPVYQIVLARCNYEKPFMAQADEAEVLLEAVNITNPPMSSTQLLESPTDESFA